MEILYTMEESRRYHLIRNYIDGLRSIDETAKALGLSTRQVKRIKKRVLKEGEIGVVHRSKGKKRTSGTIPPEMKEIILSIRAEEPYRDANFVHLRELLKDQLGISISYTALYKLLTSAGVKSNHRLRARRDCLGELIQADGTPYDWFGTGKRYTLHGLIDDATSKIVGLYLCEHECLFGYLEATRQMLENYGIPAELYPDKYSVFFPSSKQKYKLSIEEELAGKTISTTQYGAIMHQLGVDMHAAPTSEAKGRIERLWNTLQDRLPIEFALAGIKTIEEANAFLSKYIEKFNKQFSIEPKSSENKFCPVPDYLNLDLLLSMKFTRKLDRGGTFSIRGHKFQVLDSRITTGTKVNIYMSNKIGIIVCHNNKDYKAICIEDLPNHYKSLNFDKFCQEHTEKTTELISYMMSYNAKKYDPLLTSS